MSQAAGTWSESNIGRILKRRATTSGAWYLPAATTERVRALQFLAHYPNGFAEALMLAHDFTVVCLAGLAQGRLLTAELNVSHVVWMQITDLGREALTREPPKSSVPQFDPLPATGRPTRGQS
jgi:hypothetical protein